MLVQLNLEWFECNILTAKSSIEKAPSPELTVVAALVTDDTPWHLTRVILRQHIVKQNAFTIDTVTYEQWWHRF